MASGQVSFKDTVQSRIHAVEADKDSTYTAEDTSFEGFDGEVGDLYRTSIVPLQRTVKYRAIPVLMPISNSSER